MDLNTLRWADVGALPLISVILLAIWVLDRRLVSLVVLSGALALQTAAALLFALRGSIPMAWTIVGGNAVALLAYGMIWSAVRLAETRTPSFLLAAPPLFWIAACCIPAFYHSVPLRVALASALIAVLDAAIFREFATPVADLPTRRLGAALFVLHGVIFATRTAWAIGSASVSGGGGSPTTGLLNDVFTIVIYFVSLTHLAAVSLVLVTIVKERAELQVRQLERRRHLLVLELNHRVKNLLSTILSISNQTASRSNGDLLTFTERYAERIMALARAHDLLQEQGWEAVLVRDVVIAALSPWLQSGQISVSGNPAIHLTPDLGQLLVLALHELATNAMRYGALSNPEGQVDVALSLHQIEAVPTMHLAWNEQGGPVIAGPMGQIGFGRTLLERGLPRQTGGMVTFDIQPTGLRLVIRMPVPRPKPPDWTALPAA